jgi:PucR C-terminal helix-turn-helix domain
VERDIQEIVDALSLRLGRPVLIDDVELRPLAYSTQFGELDAVRTSSILARLAPEPARVALFEEGIRTASGPVRIPAHPDIGMRARVCVPLTGGGRRLGYLWLLDDPPVSAEELQLARRAAVEAAAVVQPQADAARLRRRREQELITALLGIDPRGAHDAARELDGEAYLGERPLRVWAAAPDGPASDEWHDDVLERLLARLPTKQALCGHVDGAIVWLAGARWSLGDVASQVLGGVRGPRALIGEGEPVEELCEARISHRRALAALRVAATTESGRASWDELGVDRLVSSLPESALDDLPDGLRRLLADGEESLVVTLEAYLEHAGDAKRTAEALSLHRGGLYYRLRRIEEIAGVDLHSGEDRLLCHLALRLARLR